MQNVRMENVQINSLQQEKHRKTKLRQHLDRKQIKGFGLLLDHDWFWMYFRKLLGHLEALLQILAPHRPLQQPWDPPPLKKTSRNFRLFKTALPEF